MFDVVLSGGWLMWPLMLCSTLALAIIAERIWTLQKDKVIPDDVLPNLLHLLQNNRINKRNLKQIAEDSPLGSILCKGVMVGHESRETILTHMAEQARHVIHNLERYLNALGTIAAITPLIGLLGTVMGMIQVFSAITLSGPTNTEALAGGISQALITTAFGLSVAIPSMMFHRHFNRKIDEFTVFIEQEASKLADYVRERQHDEGFVEQVSRAA